MFDTFAEIPRDSGSGLANVEKRRPPHLDDVKATLVSQLAESADLLAKRSVTDEAVHDVRKTLKRARASLRLLRDAVGDQNYSSENMRIRDAAHPLSRMRDAKVILETTGDLHARHTGRKGRSELRRIQTALREERADVRRELLHSKVPAAVVRALHAAQRQAERMPISGAAQEVLSVGATRVYSRGRKVFARARSGASNETLHESRKQAKYLAHAMETFEPVGKRWIGKVVKRAKSMADDLGTNHDLAVLHERIVDLLPEPSRSRHAIFASIARQRDSLRKKALEQGRKLYACEAEKFRRRLTNAL